MINFRQRKILLIMDKSLRILISGFLLFFLTSTHALIEETKQWSDFNIQGPFSKDSPWLYWAAIQNRLIDHVDYFDDLNMQGGIGYSVLNNLSFWQGYQWFSNNQMSDLGQENRLWQMMVYTPINNPQLRVISRSRMEERRLESSGQWGFRFRERVNVVLPQKIFHRYSPEIYDEILIKLNQPDWISSNNTFDQNRFFVGIQFPTSRISYLELGYINQYLIREPENIMANIIYCGFFVNPT